MSWFCFLFRCLHLSLIRHVIFHGSSYHIPLFSFISWFHYSIVFLYCFKSQSLTYLSTGFMFCTLVSQSMEMLSYVLQLLVCLFPMCFSIIFVTISLSHDVTDFALGSTFRILGKIIS